MSTFKIRLWALMYFLAFDICKLEALKIQLFPGSRKRPLLFASVNFCLSFPTHWRFVADVKTTLVSTLSSITDDRTSLAKKTNVRHHAIWETTAPPRTLNNSPSL